MKFDDARKEKWVAGRVERGIEDQDGFFGDAAKEIMEEALDLANYADQLHSEHRILEEELTRMLSLSREIYQWASQVAK